MDDLTTPLNVLVLNDFCHVQGGASKVAVDEAVALAQAGAQVTFVGAVGPVCDALMAAPLDVACLDQPELMDAGKHPLALLRSMWNPSAYARVGALLRGLDPARTVVHLHGYTKALSTSPMLAARRASSTLLPPVPLKKAFSATAAMVASRMPDSISGWIA